jgi:hypothetical protein
MLRYCQKWAVDEGATFLLMIGMSGTCLSIQMYTTRNRGECMLSYDIVHDLTISPQFEKKCCAEE